jgi:hypothetical protein
MIEIAIDVVMMLVIITQVSSYIETDILPLCIKPRPVTPSLYTKVFK